MRTGSAPVADAALELSGVDGVEVLYTHEWGGLTRFANSVIHQIDVPGGHRTAGPRGRRSGRVGVAATNEFSARGAREAAQSAKEMAEVARPDPLFPGLAPARRRRRSTASSRRRPNASPETRAEAVAELIGTCPPGFVGRRRVRNHGGRAGDRQLRRAAMLVAGHAGVAHHGDDRRSEHGSGFAEAFSGSAEVHRRRRRSARRAADKARAEPRSPKALDAGDLPGGAGAGGRRHAGRVPGLRGVRRQAATWRTGPASAARRTSRWRRRRSRSGTTAPTRARWARRSTSRACRRERVDLIRDGVFLDAVYDLRTGKQAGRPSTGHGLPSPNPEGPFPLNLFMEHGGRHRRGHGEGRRNAACWSRGSTTPTS